MLFRLQLRKKPQGGLREIYVEFLNAVTSMHYHSQYFLCFSLFKIYLESVLGHILEMSNTWTSKISYSFLFTYFYEKSLKTHRMYTNPTLTGANDKPSVGLRSSKVRPKEVYASFHLSALLTIHVIVSSRLLPPPPPTSEGATFGARKTEETTKMNTEYAVIKNQNKQTNTNNIIYFSFY